MFTDLRVSSSMTEFEENALLNTHYSFAIQKQNFLIKIATTKQELEQSFRLRKRVYSLQSDGFDGELDYDKYDLQADHLLIIDQERNQIVGTYRLLLSDKVSVHYAEREFDLTHFKNLHGRKLELGRACVDPEMRSGVIITLLWRGIAEYIKLSGAQYLFGCSTIWGASPEETHLIYRYMVEENLITNTQVLPLPHTTSPFWQEIPKSITSLTDKEKEQIKELIPTLVKTYIRIGIKFCAPPGYDPKLKAFEFFGYIKVTEINSDFKRKYL